MGHYPCPHPRAVAAPPWHLQRLDFLLLAVERGGNQAASVCQLRGADILRILTFSASKIYFLVFARQGELSTLVSDNDNDIAAGCRTPSYQPTPSAVCASSLCSPTAPGCVYSSETNSPSSVRLYRMEMERGKSKYLQSKVS